MPKAPPIPNTDIQKEMYMRKTFGGNFVPTNEFEHAWTMTNSEMPNESDLKVALHSGMVDSHIQNSTIGNDTILKTIQDDMPFLHSMLSIVQQNEDAAKAFGSTYKIMFFSWRDSVILTKAKEGMENQSQHATGNKRQPTQFGGAYGAEQLQQQNQKKGFDLGSIFGKKKQG